MVPSGGPSWGTSPSVLCEDHLGDVALGGVHLGDDDLHLVEVLAKGTKASKSPLLLEDLEVLADVDVLEYNNPLDPIAPARSRAPRDRPGGDPSLRGGTGT